MTSLAQARNEAGLELAAAIARYQIYPSNLTVTHIACGISKLQQLAKSLHNRYEAQCGYEWANTEKYQRRTKNMENNAQEIAKELFVELEIQTDPRSWPFIFTIGSTEIRLG